MTNRLTSKIETLMHAPQAGASPLGRVLQVLAWAYGAGVRHRNRQYARGRREVLRLPCRVVSVGNLSVGGTGKTPMTVFLARQLQERGLRCVILSRGYRGRAEKRGGLVSDLQQVRMTAREAGDEPYLMACALPGVPVMVGRDRYRSGMAAMAGFDPQIIVMDDGFQHRRVHRDVDLVLMDATHPAGNGHLLPRGVLREPLTALARAHLLVLTRADREDPQAVDWLRAVGVTQPIFAAAHRMDVVGRVAAGQPLGAVLGTRALCGWEVLAGRRAVVFSGLARPQAFERGLARKGIEIRSALRFGDHHAYRQRDLANINDQARRLGADVLITSRKDYVRLKNGPPLAYDLVVVDATLQFFDAHQGFMETLIRKLRV